LLIIFRFLAIGGKLDSFLACLKHVQFCRTSLNCLYSRYLPKAWLILTNRKIIPPTRKYLKEREVQQMKKFAFSNNLITYSLNLTANPCLTPSARNWILMHRPTCGWHNQNIFQKYAFCCFLNYRFTPNTTQWVLFEFICKKSLSAWDF
jgi:hypothetical protein